MMKMMLAALCFLANFLFVSAYDNGVAATPPMGWSTWCTNDICGIPDRCSEPEVHNKVGLDFSLDRTVML